MTKNGNHEGKVIRVLHLEDNPLDVELVKELLRDSGLTCELTAVGTRAEYLNCLRQRQWDVILSDFALPSFDGWSALEAARRICSTTPFIFVTGTMGEHYAVESLKNGATDYVLKQNLIRLGSSVRRALKEADETLRRLDVEAKLLKSQEQHRFLAYHDALTGLPNRAFLLERLSEVLSEAARHGEKAGLLFIDLDHFKMVNDSLGHAAGDMVLKSIALRLLKTARKEDIVSRLGGDEYVIVLRNIKDCDDAGMAADRVRSIVAEEQSISHLRLVNTCSIGISVFPDDAGDAERLMSNADAAAYAAKENGRNQWQFFTQDMNRRTRERLTLENAMRRALAENQLYVEYQPQMEISTGRVIGAEALLRWRHPELGLVPPSEFIPVAERTGEILPIGEWVLKTACAQAQDWQREGKSPLTIAVNVSAVQFRHPSFLDLVQEVLKDTRLDPKKLELEITESQLMESPEKAMELLRQLREMGPGLAIDDFGRGYCGLSYLRDFQFSRLKIDQSFVRSVLVDARDAALTAAIIHMASVLRMKVIAECVETLEQMKLLQELGCQEIQGFYFSRPVSAAAFAENFLEPHTDFPSRTNGSAPVAGPSGREVDGGLAFPLQTTVSHDESQPLCPANTRG